MAKPQWLLDLQGQITEEDLDLIPDYFEFRATLKKDNGEVLQEWVSSYVSFWYECVVHPQQQQ